MNHFLDPCNPSPCKNDGRCTRDGKGAFNCACINGYTGATCNDGILKEILTNDYGMNLQLF